MSRPRLWVGFLASLALGSCAPTEPFPGGRSLDLDCVEERRAPTEAELETLIAALIKTYVGERDPASLDLLLEMDTYVRRDDQQMSNRARAIVALGSGGRFRFESQNRGVTTLLLRDGAEAWSILEDAPPGMVQSDRAQPVIWFDKALYPLRYLRGDRVTLKGLPPREENGRWLVPVVCQGEHKPALTLLIDPEGPLIRAVEASLPVTVLVREAQVTEEVRFEFADHRRESGVLVPFAIRALSQGAVAQILDLIQVEVDPDLDGVAFRSS